MAAAANLGVDEALPTCDWEPLGDMRRLNSGSEERPRLTAALSCLKSAADTGNVGSDACGPEQQDAEVFAPSGPPLCSPPQPAASHGRSISISVVPCSDARRPDDSAEGADVEPSAPLYVRTAKAPPTKSSHTPPTARKLLQLFPNITMMRSKSQESQLAHRIEEPGTPRSCKKSKVLAALQVNGSRNGPEDAALRSPLPAIRTPGPAPGPAPATPSTPNTPYRRSPQTPRRDIGLAVTHRFSTKSWLSQTCQVCRRGMMFGVKCKHCKLKCHNKCTKDAPSCRISFFTLPRMRRAESVPSDINNRIDRTAEIPLQFGTLPKMMNRREPAPTIHQMDSSSNASSATSSAPSSPAHLQQSDPSSISTTPPPNPSSQWSRENNCFYFPDVPAAPPVGSHLDQGQPQPVATEMQTMAADNQELEGAESPAEDEEEAVERQQSLEDEDGLEELPSSIRRLRGLISRKISQTSVYLQEWDIPYEQLQLGDLIGKGRWGKVHKGRWHGEVAIRLLEVDGNNQDHLKLFKKEVMNYRQTRHENVILFMGACMVPPHLAIITSFCKGLTLYSMVRERAHMLEVNKTRQIAQDIVNGMSYLHAKGIVHKDLKSKNVFYDTNKVVITDFGLFGMSGLVQEGRRKNVLRIPRGWLYYLAPEIVRQMSPEVEEDQLPFSRAADVYAFGTIWYELQVGDWPLTNQPVEAKIWLFGSSEGIKQVLAAANVGKEITEILSACWSAGASERPTFTQLAGMLERLPKLNRRLSHPGHFRKNTEYES
ncbi:kinase suppressor of Ras 1-like isoform X2 [Takifugu flavidus]|uniref:kinase suppressor of Ras 1-like isoform X2 n=1 Tax=Takifugu flavidus TaxID=433684 RepID=UPI0025448991|nr:kinase suppressor of Ras 1-like isoform X2 [Takifugu flavidus]